MQTIRVKPWADGQGSEVLINATDYDPEFHVRFEDDDTPIPGPYDHLDKDALIALCVDRFREELKTWSEGKLRFGLIRLDREAAARLAGEAAPAPEFETGGVLIVTPAEGTETLQAGEGEPTVAAGEGTDTLSSGGGDATEPAPVAEQTVSGGEGEDTVTASEAADTVTSAGGEDTISASDAAETLPASDGEDSVTAAISTDTVAAGEGGDTASAGEGEPTGLGAEPQPEIELPSHPPGDADGDGLAREDMTKAELKAQIMARGGTYPADANKVTLQEILAGLMASQTEA